MTTTYYATITTTDRGRGYDEASVDIKFDDQDMRDATHTAHCLGADIMEHDRWEITRLATTPREGAGYVRDYTALDDAEWTSDPIADAMHDAACAAVDAERCRESAEFVEEWRASVERKRDDAFTTIPHAHTGQPVRVAADSYEARRRAAGRGTAWDRK